MASYYQCRQCGRIKLAPLRALCRYRGHGYRDYCDWIECEDARIAAPESITEVVS